ncbi:MAG: DUF6036 family nucleotidyltransferase [Anaerolineae bacterium]
MDESELLATLGQLDTRLTTAFDVVIVGGAAMILHFGASRATRDVDVIVLRGNLRQLRRAVAAVAVEAGLPEDWLNDGAKGFVGLLPPDFRTRLRPLEYPFKHLRLYALSLPDQVVLKIIALRAQDLEDLALLLPQVRDADRKDVIAAMHYLNRARSDWAQRVQYFLEEQGWNLD